ncbi:rhamnogalacturonan acetylesterase [Streptomyces beijiangensis]|uniref:Rhamnogalacturonan acetylesterase n=1 Tax=Streptomyces beijiangensis TaxID=163361 RepID=A0A939JJ60_9ACTN|nr:rhamnogalacturonan acetylesterase [Streptomyces beijiangensis]MBO0516243.1 rhamnogalacturonan acetylesterase [Streptomyces beijiangensis]
MRRAGTALLAAITAAAALTAVPAQASPRRGGLGHCTATAPFVCHFDVAPGTYRVSALLGGGTEAGATRVTAETRRAVLAETPNAPGERVRRSFTVDVRTPEGEPTGPGGTPGLDLTFDGAAPQLAALRVTRVRTSQILLAGDSTVCDQPGDPYNGWGQQLPQYLTDRISVANYADSGESSQTFLDNPALFATLRTRIHHGDLVLVQLAHNDKQTDRDTYRANLTAMIEGIRAEGGRPVLVTPIVRRWFNADGTLDNGTALIVNGLGVDLPAELRTLATEQHTPLVDLTALSKARVEALGPEGSKAYYLYNEKKDNTHTSATGAAAFAQLVLGELRAKGLVPASSVRPPS